MKLSHLFIKTIIFTGIFVFWKGKEAQAQVKQLWGMTTSGGQYGIGTIFSTDSIGNNHTVKFNFSSQNEGSTPKYTQLTQANDGKLYGMTSSGGTSNLGILFQYDPSTGSYLKKLDFSGSSNGKNPTGSLTLASDGKLYGMTSRGGINDMGVLFQYDPITDSLLNKMDFAGTTNGSTPYGSLMQASDGKLYGMAYAGGANNYGVLFQYDPNTSTYNKKIDFTGATIGSYPEGSLIQANNGKLYGMTTGGGVNLKGVLFQYDIVTSSCTKKLDFSGITKGESPFGSLVQAGDGKLYGMTSEGGANNLGVLFQYDPGTSIFIKKIDFAGTTNGKNPYGSLMLASDGKLYGMTYLGGTNNTGILFQYDPTNSTLSKKFDFVGVKGAYPFGSLMQASDGNLYGMTYAGGAGKYGVLFQYNLSSSVITKKVDFQLTTNGQIPKGSLILGNDGKLYGMTYTGGNNALGVLFQYDPITSTFIKKIDFDGLTNGSTPYGSLLQASDGKFYGLTFLGGTSDMGVLFQFDPATSACVKKVDFLGATNGSHPYASLIQATDGKLYGTTADGGANAGGVLFQYDPTTSVYTKKYDFGNFATGQDPQCSLMQATDGKLYGMTTLGGLNNMGVLFQYDPATSIFTKKLDFSGTTNGKFPYGSLMQASDGKIYGMTREGGTYSKGVLFQYDPVSSVFIKKFDFLNFTSGIRPHNSLVQSSDGKLYGTTGSGGGFSGGSLGTIFQFDPATSTFITKLDFTGANGSYSTSNLIEIIVNSVGIITIEKEQSLQLYPNPTHDFITLELLQSNQKSATVLIKNMLGQVIWTRNYPEKSMQHETLSFVNEPAGIYFVEILTNNTRAVRKIIVE